MGKAWMAYCQETGVDPSDRVTMRVFLRKEMRRNEDGTPAYITEQKDKDAADVNKIIRRFDAKGIMELQNQFSMDETILVGIDGGDYKSSMDLVAKVEQEFAQLPSSIRDQFKNDPGAYVEFLARPTPAADQVDEVLPEKKKRKKTEPPAEVSEGDTTE